MMETSVMEVEQAAGPEEPSARPRPHDAEELERLGDEIAELAAHLHAATYRLLVRLREFDEREGWGNGFRSCAHWLSWRTGIGLGACREKVRAARALGKLPRIAEAMRSGELSFAKVRAVTRVATPENEARLLEVARQGTASHVETVVRAWRRLDRLEEQYRERERHARRHLTIWTDDDGSCVLRGRLDPEVGALLRRALEAAEDALYRSQDLRSPDSPSVAQRRADAIGLIAEAALRGGPAVAQETSTETITADDAARSEDAVNESVEGRPQQQRPATGRADRFRVVVHVDADALRASGENGDSVLDGVRVSAETSRRIACDASRVVMRHDADGDVLDVGRRMRTVPPAIRRALEHRDRRCRFPGCESRFCDAHHVVHWADGGATRLDNLILICRRHHRAVHEEGFSVMKAAEGGVVFRRPNGQTIPQVPSAPRLSEDPVATLRAAHRAEGIEPHAWTPTPAWTGERLDLNFAILALRNP